jgi:uncharacterized protein (DUF927 family)
MPNEHEERRKDVEQNAERFRDFGRDPKTRQFKVVTKADAQAGDKAPDRDAYRYGGGFFTINEDRDAEGFAAGVVYRPPPDEDKPKVWICAPLRVVARTRDSHGKAWGRLLQWEDADGTAHEWAMPDELVQRDGGVEARCELARQGLAISPARNARDLLAIYLNVCPVDVRVRCVERLGWAKTKDGTTYVLPTEIPDLSSEHVVFQNNHALEPAHFVAGSDAEWRDKIGSLARGNSRVTFTISCAFAGPLLELVNETSGGFHLRGPSTTGKTTALRLSASVWGEPSKYSKTWRATANGLEAMAALHNDGTLILDEIAELDPREAGEVSYMLANGLGKTRATRVGTARPIQSWRLLFLSAGEESLASHLGRIGRKPTVGQEIRLAEIDADAGAGKGILEKLHGYQKPEELIRTLNDNTMLYHGAVGVEYLKRVVAERSELEKSLRIQVREFVRECENRDVGAQTRRVACRFGLVAAAGELATSYGLTGWNEGEAKTAVLTCFWSWLNIFGAGNREERRLLDQVRTFLAKHGSSRFEDKDAEYDPQIRDRAGFYHTVPGTDQDGKPVKVRQYLVFPDIFRDEICAGHTLKSAIKVLEEHGWLVPEGDKTAQSIYIPRLGRNRRTTQGCRAECGTVP